MLGINTPPGERDGEFGLAAVPGREKDWDALFARALDYITAIGGSAIHCLAGKVAPEQRPAAERVFVANLTRAADLAAAKNITLLIEPINRARPAELFSQPRRARRRHHRQGRQAEHQDPVRFLSRADRRRRSDHAASRNTCRWSAICRCAAVPVAARAGRGRDQLSRRVRGGRPARLHGLDRRANTGRAGAPRTASAGAAPYGLSSAVNRLTIKLLEKPSLFRFAPRPVRC